MRLRAGVAVVETVSQGALFVASTAIMLWGTVTSFFAMYLPSENLATC